jgi:hypothetical protein
MTCRGVSILLCALVLFSLAATNIRPSVSGVSSFFWLKRGTQALYSLPEGPALFDDHASGHPFQGNYSWYCLDVNDTHAVLQVNITLELFKPPEWTTPAHMTYFGSEFVQKAQSGDLSFIKRIPMDQVVGRIEIFESPSNPQVLVPSPIVLNQVFIVTVDLDTMMMVGEDGEPLGKWILWIDPLKYSLGAGTTEPFIMNWLGQTLDFDVFYISSANPPFDSIFGSIKRYFYAGMPNLLENELLTELGWSGMGLGCRYEPRTGVLLGSSSSDFTDDVLAQKFGAIGVHSWVRNVYFHLSSIIFVGDLNGDWQVNIVDLSIVAKAFGSRVGDAEWSQSADLNGDGVINIVDVTLAAKAFGTQYIIPD